jgi:hypothetical protein
MKADNEMDVEIDVISKPKFYRDLRGAFKACSNMIDANRWA